MGSKSTAALASGAEACTDSLLQTTIQVLSECGLNPAQICETVGVSQATVEAALSQDRYAVAARCLAKKKIPFHKIAELLHMSDARVHSAVNGDGIGHAVGGRLLGNALQLQLDDLCDENTADCCPVTLVLFVDPVIASDGFMYESESCKQLIRNHMPSPITREPLKKEIIHAKQKKSEVMTFREQRSEALLKFAKDAMPSEPQLATTALERVVEYLGVLKAANYPTIARATAALWEQTDLPLPDMLRPHLGMSQA